MPLDGLCLGVYNTLVWVLSFGVCGWGVFLGFGLDADS